MRRAKTKGRRYYELAFVFHHNGSREALQLGEFLERVFGKHRITNYYCNDRISGREILGVLSKRSEIDEIRLECPDGSFWTGRDRIINVVEQIVLNSASDKRKEIVAEFKQIQARKQ